MVHMAVQELAVLEHSYNPVAWSGQHEGRVMQYLCQTMTLKITQYEKPWRCCGSTSC